LRCSSKLSRSETKKFRSLLRCNSKLSRSRACYCNVASSHALELVVATQQALTLRSLLLQRTSSHAPEPKSSEACCVAASKLRSRTSSRVCCCNAASSGTGQAPEFAALQQQALTLWSLLLQRSKLSCFGACYVAASKLRRLLLQRNKLSRSGACCCNAVSSGAEKLRSLLRCRV